MSKPFSPEIRLIKELMNMWHFFNSHRTKKVTLDGAEWFSWEPKDEMELIKIVAKIERMMTTKKGDA